MLIATKTDRKRVVDILASAFENNKSVNYIVRQGGGRGNRIRSLMGYSFDICMQFGEVWLSDDRQACLLYLYPEKKKSSLLSTWADIKLIFQAIGISGILKAIDREKQIKDMQLQGKTIYLWFIGVQRSEQQKGIGSKLLNELLDVADIESRVVILETSSQRNLPWYKKLGFQEYALLDLSYHLHFLKKEPEL
jgi:ribosomal protein S18 acetylase RimI-like enzyme